MSRQAQPNWQARKNDETPEAWKSTFGRLPAQVLWQRGLSEHQDIERFLNPRLDSLQSPLRLKNLKEAAERLSVAILRQEKIVVYGDYDIDGMSGLALLVSFFRECGGENISYFQPDRLSEGYGVHPQAIANLAALGAQVIVTVDTGIGALEAALKAKELGVELIITDHHQQILSSPEGAIIVNPNQFGDDSGLGYLSGTGVAFYLSLALRMELTQKGHFSNRKLPDIKNYLDLFVLGTVADSVDLIGENRILVHAGLKYLARSQRPGLRALIDRVVAEPLHLNVRDVGFSIAPKLNAASRLGRAELSTQLLLCQDPAEASFLVEELMRLNSQRSEIQAQVFKEALEQALLQISRHDPPVLIVDGPWHEGVLGIVAAKLVEKLSRPSIVLSRHSENRLRGSMRTLSHFSCIRALETGKEFLIKYGGHRMAAGLHLEESHKENFSQIMWTKAKGFLDSMEEEILLQHDGKLPDALQANEVETLSRLAPFGNGNPEPLFLVEGMNFDQAKILKEEHLKCRNSAGIEVIGFYKAKEFLDLQKSGAQRFDVLVTPEINRFRGLKSVQLRLQYVRPHAPTHFGS